VLGFQLFPVNLSVGMIMMAVGRGHRGFVVTMGMVVGASDSEDGHRVSGPCQVVCCLLQPSPWCIAVLFPSVWSLISLGFQSP
jgi:hypothetical protein